MNMHISTSCISSMYPSMANCIHSRIVPFSHQTFISCSCSSSMSSDLQSFSSPKLKAETIDKMDYPNVQRRTANYKPNIWKYDLLQSLTSEFSDKKHYKTRAHKLKEDVRCMFDEAGDPLSKLELIDSISKLGLDKHFENEIIEALDTIELMENSSGLEEDLYATALRFRLLRHYGYDASQDMFQSFVDGTGKFVRSPNISVEAFLELFEASNLGREGENILDEARLYSIESLNGFGANSDYRLAKQNFQAMNLPLSWRVEWFNVKKQISAHEKDSKTNSKLIELSKINFNLVQASHQKDLKEILRWWMNHGNTEKLSFSRDRIVESFLYAAGTASEPQYGSLRKWLSKVIKLILIIDDVFDVYGSLEELECFTNAVERWRPEEVKELPEGIKICFWTLFNTTEEIAAEIQQEKGWNNPVLPYLQKTWADLCKSFILEAKWYDKDYTPSLKEYLKNGWISSSGPLLSLLVILGVANAMTRDIADYLKDYEDVIYHASLIIRLCNDQGTSEAELERGDAASSILCHMREANVSEEVAREHIRSLIMRTWRNINSLSKTTTPFLNEPIKYIINTAKAAHFIYQNGDGFGVQDPETRDQVLSNFIEPLAIHI